VTERSTITTFLFTDIEGSTRLWEEDPERMRPALARHDAIAREAVERHGGEIVKMTGDGVHAAFEDPLDAVRAALEIQLTLADAQRTNGIALLVRCGLHAGTVERRDNDFYGTAVNRAARIMSAAHGGQTLLSRTVAEMVESRLPEGITLCNLGPVRLRDLSRPEHVYQVVHPSLRAEFPALRSLEETPNNLPNEVNSFVGRGRELTQVAALMRQGRMVTLIGLGGLGKTRLALHVAAETMDEYPDGVWFVELAPLGDPRLVALSIATAMRVKEEAGRPIIEALVKHMASRKLLVVLDNCEHLLEGCCEVARQLLSEVPEVRILATSREPLRIAGETTFPVLALGIPDIRLPFEPRVISQFDAVQLFLDRAAAAQPEFELTEANSTHIAAICHRVDGIPLAIELAAARVRSLPVQKIAERLTDRFKILRGGDQAALPRQQTLRALIDWSYDLLTPEERRLFRQLAVFAGGFSLEAAESVCDCRDDDVIDLLGRLVEKSLVVLDARTGRYGLLETVRQYAHERLNDVGEEHEVHDKHLDHYAQFAHEAQGGIAGGASAKWLLAVDSELENIVSAHAWAGQSPDDAQRGLQLANCMKRYWLHRGLLELGSTVMTEALARPGASPRNIDRCRGLLTAGQLHYVMGEYREARDRLEESLSIARELGDGRSIAGVSQSLGMADYAQGDLAAARTHLSEALALARDPRTRAPSPRR
jgi:predicted ATPase/class 3 adenylate cyclase